ncbi:MAG TPA: hypothetical protein VKP68_01440, partial [Ramlibacter sp.]|nr:hypothetical protein [Ramlibacter sp.]
APAPAPAPGTSPGQGSEPVIIPAPITQSPSSPGTQADPQTTPVAGAAAAPGVPAPAPVAVEGVRGGAAAGTPEQALGLAGAGQPAFQGQSEVSLAAQAARPLGELETSRLIRPVTFDRGGIQLIAAESFDLTSNRFDITGIRQGAVLEDLQRTLRSSAFSDQLDELRSTLYEQLELDKTITISVAGVSLGLSLVYVLWLIRGGVLMGSYLSALPAWRVLDPLPVLSRVDEEAEEDDEALDAVTDDGGNPLRGFG